MRYITLNNCTKRVAQIGLGTMGVGGKFQSDDRDDEFYVKAIKNNIEQGINFIDTAEVYAAGRSEIIIGKAVKDIREKVFIASKVSPENLRYDDLIKAAKSSLIRMNTDYLDLYQVHWPNDSIPMIETMEAMKLLKKEGVIRHIGVSNFSLKELKHAQALLGDEKIEFLQIEYNLFDRGAEKDVIPYCQKNNIKLIAYSPLDQGHVVWNAELRNTLEKNAKKLNMSASQLALAFICRNPDVIAIPKALSHKNIELNASALDHELSVEQLEILSDSLKNSVNYVDYDDIKPYQNDNDRNVYTTIEDAINNHLGFSPSPVELADSIKKDANIKAIRVSLNSNSKESQRYLLNEGRIRYWAWVIAFGNSKQVPVLIRS